MAMHWRSRTAPGVEMTVGDSSRPGLTSLDSRIAGERIRLALGCPRRGGGESTGTRQGEH
eukprot:1284189-Rhodomonas_salina.3